jgi:hypothetical protein
MHDGHHVDPAAERRYTVTTVDRLIPRLRARGLEFGTICEPPAADAQEAELAR